MINTKTYLTNEKYHFCDLTLNELLTEYKAIMKMFQSTFHDYLYTNEDDVNKSIRFDEYMVWFEKRNTFARAIADKLTE